MTHCQFRKTIEWKTFASTIRAASNFECQFCGIRKNKGLHVHHLDEKHYEDLDPAAFMCLCSTCHKLIHMYSRKLPRTIWVRQLKELIEQFIQNNELFQINKVR